MKKNILILISIFSINLLQASEHITLIENDGSSSYSQSLLPNKIASFYSPYYFQHIDTIKEYINIQYIACPSVDGEINLTDGDIDQENYLYKIITLNEEKIRADFEISSFLENIFEKKLIVTGKNFKDVFLSKETENKKEIIALKNKIDSFTYVNYEYSTGGCFGLTVKEYNGSGNTRFMLDLTNLSKFKLQNGYDYCLQNFEGKTLLMEALDKDISAKYIRYILKNAQGSGLEIQDKDKKTALSRIIISNKYYSIYNNPEFLLSDIYNSAFLHGNIANYNEIEFILNRLIENKNFEHINFIFSNEINAQFLNVLKQNAVDLLSWTISKGYIDLVKIVLTFFRNNDVELCLDDENGRELLNRAFLASENKNFFVDDVSDCIEDNIESYSTKMGMPSLGTYKVTKEGTYEYTYENEYKITNNDIVKELLEANIIHKNIIDKKVKGCSRSLKNDLNNNKIKEHALNLYLASYLNKINNLFDYIDDTKKLEESLNEILELCNTREEIKQIGKDSINNILAKIQ